MSPKASAPYRKAPAPRRKAFPEVLVEELGRRWRQERDVRLLAAFLFDLDPGVWAHGIRVMEEASAIGRCLGFSRKSLEILEISALLHDVGKLALAPEVLCKAGPLSRGEQRLVRRHPVIGSGLLRQVDGLEGAAPAVLHHHERFDGGGYPSKLQGTVIPLAARIIAVADSLDAMLSDRPYRRRLSLHRAAAELRENAGEQFDPTVVERCLERWAPPRPRSRPEERKPLLRSVRTPVGFRRLGEPLAV